MSEEAKYKGVTAAKYLEILQEEITSIPAQVESLDVVDRQAEADRQSLIVALRAEFEGIARARGLDTEDLLKKAEEELLLERVKKVGIRHPNYSQTDEFGIDSPFSVAQWELFQTLDTIEGRVRFLERFVAQGSGGNFSEGYDDLVIALEEIKRIISDGVDTEEALLYVIDVFSKEEKPDIRKKIWRLERDLEELNRFRNELAYLVAPLRARAVLFRDSGGLALQTTKIDWLGTKTDCKILVDFLKDNGYIDAPYVNKFISAHFTFKGDSVNVETVGGWKPGRDGTFLVFEKKKLEIPTRS